ncbi:MAG TPA: acyl carrier protein [Crenotrichaceae bacterium]|nr:acyl carrier protein [Crenotrichaceae bacterium]
MKTPLRQFVLTELVYCDDINNFGDTEDLLEAGMDSMGIMRLIMFAEREFKVTLPDTEVEPDSVRSINALVGWIEEHKK